MSEDYSWMDDSSWAEIKGWCIEAWKKNKELKAEGDSLKQSNIALDFMIRVAEKKQFENEQKLEAIRELLKEKQYMDEAIILQLNILEILNAS